MEQIVTEDSEGSLKVRRLIGICALFGEVEGNNMLELRTMGQRKVDEQGRPGHTYHMSVLEGGTQINEIALCRDMPPRRTSRGT